MRAEVIISPSYDYHPLLRTINLHGTQTCFYCWQSPRFKRYCF